MLSTASGSCINRTSFVMSDAHMVLPHDVASDQTVLLVTLEIPKHCLIVYTCPTLLHGAKVVQEHKLCACRSSTSHVCLGSRCM